MRALNPALAEALQYAHSVHQAGNHAEAARVYRLVLRAEPDQFDALHLLGVLEAQRGNNAEADRLLDRALRVNSRSADALNNRANVLRDLKRHNEALAIVNRALEIRQEFPEALNSRGSILHELKRYEEALASLDRSLALKPRNVSALNNRGIVLLDMGRPEEALAPFDQALTITPTLPEVWNNRGNALRALRRWDEALKCYDRSLAINPHYVKALRARGDLLHALIRDDEAVASLSEAAAIEPNSGILQLELANVLFFSGRRTDAEAHYRRALSLDPDLAEARFELCICQLPIVCASEAEIVERREAYEAELNKLSSEVERGLVKGDLAVGLASHAPFYLGYQGRNDRELQGVYGSLACRIVGNRYSPAPMSAAPRAGERIRLGIVSHYFREHSAWKMRIKSWLTQLDRQRFQIFGYHTGAERDGATELAASLCDRFVQGLHSIEDWRQAIIADAPHVLLYPAIGMDGHSVVLAAQRLAPVQCCSWSHPVTTGLPTVDYFLSSELMEPPNGQEHYTETLVRLPNLGVYYEPIEVKPIPVDRAQLGLRQTASVFWCAQSLFKFLPRHDEVFPLIARGLSDSQFVFVPYRGGTAVTEVFQERLRKAFAAFGMNAADHCVFLPRLDQDRYITAIGQCDVFLDSIGWSGCNTTLESLAHDLPIVTRRGDLMRARHAAAILERMGITDTIVETVDDFISTAVRLGRDVPWRNAIKQRIATNKDKIYRDRAALSALEAFLDRAARR